MSNDPVKDFKARLDEFHLAAAQYVRNDMPEQWRHVQAVKADVLAAYASAGDGAYQRGYADGIKHTSSEADRLREALAAYVETIAAAGGGDKTNFMAAIRAADNNARAALLGDKS